MNILSRVLIVLGEDLAEVYFLRLVELAKHVFDDAPDSGSARTTVFLFPCEVDAEMKAAGQPKPAGERKVPDAPPARWLAWKSWRSPVADAPLELYDGTALGSPRSLDGLGGGEGAANHPHGEACPASLTPWAGS